MEDIGSKKYSSKPYTGDNFDGYTLVVKNVILVDLLVFIEEFKFYCKYVCYRIIREDLKCYDSVLLTVILYLDNSLEYVKRFVTRSLEKVSLKLDIMVTRTKRERIFVRTISKDQDYRIVRGDKDRSILKHLSKEIKFVSSWALDGDSFGLSDVVVTGPKSKPPVTPPIKPVIEPIQPIDVPVGIPANAPVLFTREEVLPFFRMLTSKYPTLSFPPNSSSQMYADIHSYFKNLFNVPDDSPFD